MSSAHVDWLPMSESMLTARFLRNLARMALVTITIAMTLEMTLILMKLLIMVMRGNLLRMVGDDEVGRSREQGVDLGRRRFYFWTD